jgi:hypothetical protein
MFTKLLSAACLVLVLALAGYTRAAQDPVARYQFEGANDFSNTGTNTAALTGEPKGNAQIIWDDQRASYVLSLDGDGDYLYFDRSWQGIVTTEMTVAAWINTSSLGSSDSIIVSLGYAWRLRNGTGGSAAFQVMDTKPVSIASGTIPVNDGLWHHVAGAYNGTQYTVYIDGRIVASVAAAGVLQGGATAYYGVIGAHYKRSDGAPKMFFKGMVDDVRIYDRVLSEEEMREITGLAGVKAAEPSPSDGRQLDVVEGVVLSWKPGVEAVRHDVYFGASLDDVTTAATTADPGSVYKGRQDPNQYAVGTTLDFGKTYYWRIDEVGGPPSSTIYKGDVWRFTAEPLAYVIPGSVITASASSSLSNTMGPERTIDGSGLNDNDLHSTDMEDMWLSNFDPQPAWIEYQFDKVYKLHEMWVWNQNQLVESSIGYGFKNVSIEYSVDGVGYTTLGTAREFSRAPGTSGYAHNSTVDLGGVTAKCIRLTANSNWGGWLSQYGLSEVRFFHIPVRAREPDPADGAAPVGPDVVLGWRAGRDGATHDVHLGTDREAVLGGAARVSSVTAARYDAGGLDLSRTYYWRIDEVDTAQSPAIAGDLWSFTTPDYLIVDNFEDYNDYSPREIWATWKDGYGTPNNGSTVGYPNPNWFAGEHYVETMIVHGGNQSMPLFYNNSLKYSQAERALSPAQDWTRNGIKALSLCFYGDPNNAVEQMYVKINDSRVVYDGDPAAVKKGLWTRWNIDLASSGANLANVTKLAVGFGDETNLKAGGSGKVFFDDIRLYRLAPEPPVERWFEAEAADSITAPMQTYNDPLASGGRYIGTPGDSSDETENPPVYGVAGYNFTVPEGTYKVLLRVIIVGGADSFWVRIPGAVCDPGTYQNTDWIKFNVIDKGDNWHWDEVHSDSHNKEVVKFTLPAGTHTLEIARRDAGALLDCILITNELDLDQKSLPHVIP